MSGDDAAETTHYHPREAFGPDLGTDDAKRHSEQYFPPKSVRLAARPVRGGLATKIILPLIVALVACLTGASLILIRKFSAIQLDDLKHDAANTAYLAAALGRLYLVHRNDFIKKNPEYRDKTEWLSGNHWAAAHGFVSEKEWAEATGFDPNEYAPITTLEAAAQKTLLGGMDQWLNSSRSGTELITVLILDDSGATIASSISATHRFNHFALQAEPLPHDFVEVGGKRVYVDYVDTVGSEPLVRGVARIMSLDDPDQTIGSAMVVLRTDRHQQMRTSILWTLLLVSAAVITCATLIAWYAIRRVVLPMRRLAIDMQAIAEGDFARRSGVQESDEIGQLAQAFNSMAERLRVARANEKETSRLESDLAIAKSIQNNLLPLQTPRVRGLDIHTSYRPAKEIGGDYFDFLPVDNQHMGIAVADASGKSIPAALVMSTTRAILRFVAPGNNSAAETLTRVNAILSVDIPKGMFVTAYYLILDPLNNSMLCASAGHTPLLIARKDGTVELMNPGGIALGFDNGPIFQRSIREQRVKLEQGDRVLLYTDGVVECVNPANEEYSDRRLREFLRRNRELSSYDFVGALLADLDRHRGTADMRDDTTIVTFKVL